MSQLSRYYYDLDLGCSLLNCDLHHKGCWILICDIDVVVKCWPAVSNFSVIINKSRTGWFFADSRIMMPMRTHRDARRWMHKLLNFHSCLSEITLSLKAKDPEPWSVIILEINMTILQCQQNCYHDFRTPCPPWKWYWLAGLEQSQGEKRELTAVTQGRRYPPATWEA